MKFLSVVGLAICIVGCSPSKLTQNDLTPTPIANNDQTSVDGVAIVPLYEGVVTVETGDSVVGPLSYADDEVVARNKIEYIPDTDRVKNLDEVEPRSEVAELFNKPFDNYDIRIVNVDDQGGKFGDINGALRKFGIALSEAQVETASSTGEYKPIRIKTNDISIYLIKVSASIYEILFVEVPANGSVFRSTLPMDLSPQDIALRLGAPNFKTKDSSVYLYSFFTSLRQFNIIWVEGKIDRIQYITWDGI